MSEPDPDSISALPLLQSAIAGRETHLRKSRRVRLDSGTFWFSQVRKWNWVTVRVSLVCMFFR